jgi:hypothetical protein
MGKIRKIGMMKDGMKQTLHDYSQQHLVGGAGSPQLLGGDGFVQLPQRTINMNIDLAVLSPKSDSIGTQNWDKLRPRYKSVKTNPNNNINIQNGIGTAT